MAYIKNSSGKFFRSGIGGTYPANDGDPQNYCDLDEDFENGAAEASDEFYREWEET